MGLRSPDIGVEYFIVDGWRHVIEPQNRQIGIGFHFPSNFSTGVEISADGVECFGLWWFGRNEFWQTRPLSAVVHIDGGRRRRRFVEDDVRNARRYSGQIESRHGPKAQAK